MSTQASDYEVVRTRGGALAMLDRTTSEVMHPVAGPLLEAMQLYVLPAKLEERLSSAHPEPLVLLDVGLGAGSNAVSAWNLSERLSSSARRLEVVSFDRTLEPFTLALRAEHAAAFGFDADSRSAGSSLLADGRAETARGCWRLRLGELLSELLREPAGSADVVFWDPFSPRANPALWSLAAFRALRRVCREGATVHTYSAATAVRSALLLAGFAVGVGEASAGKQSETTLAALHHEQLARPLDQRFLARLTRSSAPFPGDAPEDALAQMARLPQFA